MDNGFATLAGLLCAAHGIKSATTNEVMTASDFAWASDAPISLEQAMKEWP